MRLRKPCAHGVYDDHQACPGGEFLADDALIIEKVDGEWPKGAIKAITKQLWERSGVVGVRNFTAVDILDALTVREGAE